MQKTGDRFWEMLKKVALRDDSVTPPQSAIQNALGIFQPRNDNWRKKLFQPIPALAGSVRKLAQTPKFVYELGEEYLLQLEQSVDEAGNHLVGIVNGFEGARVILYAGEFSAETRIEAGRFEFSQITPGKCTLCFQHEGDCCWITGLTIEEITTD